MKESSNTAYLRAGVLLIPVVSSQSSVNAANFEGATNPNRPTTKLAAINVEGEQDYVQLKLFGHQPLPFTTYFPAQDFVPETRGSAYGQAVRFHYGQGEELERLAYVHIAFPPKSIDLKTARERVLGDRGLVTSQGWDIVGQVEELHYSWAKEGVCYEADVNGESMTGTIYIGEHQGNQFFAFTHYPMEYGEGFEPRANLILENLKLH